MFRELRWRIEEVDSDGSFGFAKFQFQQESLHIHKKQCVASLRLRDRHKMNPEGGSVTVSGRRVSNTEGRSGGMQSWIAKWQAAATQDYCTYKRFTASGPFARLKGGRGRYGNRQAEARAYPSISPDASTRRLALLRQVILLHRPATSSPFPPPFFFLLLSPCLLRVSSSLSPSSSASPRFFALLFAPSPIINSFYRQGVVLPYS